MSVVETINTAAGQWSWYAWHITWQASLVAALIVLIAWAGRRRSARLAYGLLVLALLKFAVWPTFSLSTGLFSHVGPAVEVPADQGPRWLLWLMMIHAAGAVAVAGWVLVHLIRLARLVRRAEPVTSGAVHRHLSYMARKMGLHRSVRLLACREGTSPMAFGVLTPSVLVPASMLEDLPPRQTATVLAHELAHHRRGDLWINWLQVVLTVVWWFNPLVWMLNRALRKMREDCCDDLLLREELATDDGYCETLLRVAATMTRTRLLAGVPHFAARLHPLGRRIVRIMDPSIHRRTPLSMARIPALILLALLLLPGLQVYSLLLPVPPTRAKAPALTARMAGAGATIAPARRSARHRRNARRMADLGTPGPVMLADAGRLRPVRLSSALLRSLPGDVAAATVHHTTRPSAWPVSMVHAGPTIRGVSAPTPTASTRLPDVTAAEPMGLGYSRGSLTRTGPITARQRAVDLIDAVADSRSEPLAPMVDAEPGPPPVGEGGSVPIADSAINALAQTIDPDYLSEPIATTVPLIVGDDLDDVEIASVQIDPLDVPGWSDPGGGASTGSGGYVPMPRTPEPTSLALLAMGAAAALRRRRR